MAYGPRIIEIHAFPIKNEMVGATYVEGTDRTPTPARRPPWTRDAEVAGPMSRFPRFKALRASWRPTFPSVGCIARADDGSWGFGVSRYGSPVIDLVNGHLGPLLVGEPAFAVERNWDMMVRAASPYGATGLASYAISAVDLALWDLKGKALRLPVYALAGGPARDRQFCYATGNDTDWHLDLGFKATKLACPYGVADGLDGIIRNEELVARTRELVGPDIELMLDCWMAFDVEFAVRMAERLRPYGLRWIEDCLTPENMEGHEALRRRLPGTTLATGEHWYSPHTFAQAAAKQLADVFQPDIAWACGFTGCLRITHLAEAAGIPVILHAGMNTPYGQHFSFAMPNVSWGEYFVGAGPGVPLKETVVFPGAAVPENGWLVPNDAPGFGLELTDAVLERLRA
jgi:L-rhamnonate dehydratase